MALFGWKKTSDTPGGGDKGPGDKSGAAPSAGAGAGVYEFSPEKAARWFDHGRTQHEAGNYEYAMTCWLSGLRFEPTNLDALKQFLQSSQSFGGAITKQLSTAAAGKTDVDKFLVALLNFACKLEDPEMAVRALSAASEIGLTEVVKFLAPIALRVAVNDKRPRKEQFLRLMEACKKAGIFEMAVRAGEAAIRLAPEDSKLSTEVRNLAAQSTMSKGGYENTGQDGGFRSNIRDAEKQRQLEEQERVVRSEGAADRIVASTKAEYDARPQDRTVIRRYAAALVQRAAGDDEQTAIGVLMKAYQETQEFGFRQDAGNIRLKIARRELKALQAAAAANPADEAAKATSASAAQKLLDMEIGEFEARVAAYPTNVVLKADLGQRYFEVGRFDEAIDLLQQAKDDAKNRATVMSYLGRAFAAKAWHEEAIGTFRLALETHGDANDAQGLELRYGLLCSLQKYAEESKDLPAAEEAGKLAGQIAVQQISFKDIRTRRDELKALTARLKSGG